ncbi:hypothetical protein H4Q26_010132 [Puccinia striiformis f. sp. tritici PST-130]|nr:hypothetical protein H4Q26_010132 [Puccinia striiformis f. sp. tritici PST-130]
MRNRQLTANGGRPTANTLYDAYDDLAFGMEGALMRQAHAGGAEYLRRYFKVTSGAYARQCRGTVWVIVKKGTEITTTPFGSQTSVTAIWEIDPAEIEAAQRDPIMNYILFLTGVVCHPEPVLLEASKPSGTKKGRV